jgi:hypothetical protein
MDDDLAADPALEVIMDVGAADPGGAHPHQDVVVVDRPRRRHLPDLDLSDAGEDNGFHEVRPFARSADRYPDTM